MKLLNRYPRWMRPSLINIPSVDHRLIYVAQIDISDRPQTLHGCPRTIPTPQADILDGRPQEIQDDVVEEYACRSWVFHDSARPWPHFSLSMAIRMYRGQAWCVCKPSIFRRLNNCNHKRRTGNEHRPCRGRHARHAEPSSWVTPKQLYEKLTSVQRAHRWRFNRLSPRRERLRPSDGV